MLRGVSVAVMAILGPSRRVKRAGLKRPEVLYTLGPKRTFLWISSVSGSASESASVGSTRQYSRSDQRHAGCTQESIGLPPWNELHERREKLPAEDRHRKPSQMTPPLGGRAQFNGHVVQQRHGQPKTEAKTKTAQIWWRLRGLMLRAWGGARVRPWTSPFTEDSTPSPLINILRIKNCGSFRQWGLHSPSTAPLMEKLC